MEHPNIQRMISEALGTIAESAVAAGLSREEADEALLEEAFLRIKIDRSSASAEEVFDRLREDVEEH